MLSSRITQKGTPMFLALKLFRSEGRGKRRREVGLTRPDELNYRMIWPKIRVELCTFLT